MALTEQEYCTLADVKAELGISGSGDDDYLERLIKAASRYIDNYCNRTFWYQSAATYKFAFKGEVRQHLPLTPVKELTSIVDSEGQYTLTLNTDYLLEDAESGAVYFEDVGGDMAWRRRGVTGDLRQDGYKKRYTCTYAGGYETPEQSATGAATLPADLQHACIMLTTDYYRNKGANPRIKRQHLLEAAIWFENNYGEENLARFLKKYKRVVQS